MPFQKVILTKTCCRWRGLKCSGCGHKFENGESVYTHIKWLKVVGHLCEKCYEAKFLDL